MRAFFPLFFTVCFSASLIAAPVISEFMASNQTTLKDGHGNYEDWMEIWNQDATPLDLAGWRLTDNAGNLSKFVFPAKVLPPGGRLVVFASNRAGSTGAATHIDPMGNLHTNFALAKDGEYLALISPLGVKSTEFAPGFPQQVDDVSYGPPAAAETLIGDGANVRYAVPVNNSPDTASPNWRAQNYNDAAWSSAAGPGLGFEAGAPVAHWALDDAPASTTALDSTGQGFNGTRSGSASFGVAGRSAATGTAVQFSGSIGKVTIPYSSALNPPASFTFAAWVYAAGSTGNYQSIVTSRVGPANQQRGYILYITPAGQWEFWTGYNSGGSGGWDITAGGAVTFGAWTHVAISRDAAGTKRLYLNGAQAGSTSSALNYLANNNMANGLHLGAGDDLGTNFRFNGVIDDATFWSTDIGAALVLQHRDSGGGSFPTPAYSSHYSINVQGPMFATNPGIYARYNFSVADKSRYSTLRLRAKFDDGYVAFLNGVEVARRNFTGTRSYNSVADSDRADTDAIVFDEVDITAAGLPVMLDGANTLAIHGMRRSLTHGDFLLTPRLDAELTPSAQAPGYFSYATPGSTNSPSTVSPGPAISSVSHAPAQPSAGQAATVTAHITPRLGPIGSVSLKYRVMYGSESASIPMTDAGPVPGATDGSRIYTGTIPASHGAAARQMLRYYITANDTTGRTWRAPYPTDLTNNDGVSQSPEYFGTVVADATLTASMPIMQWFTNDVGNSDTRTGSRASVWYGGRFYDNIYVRQRGGYTSIGSQKFNFNRRDGLYVNAALGTVGEVNMNSSGADPAHFRVSLAYDLYRTAGHPACESFPVAMYRNGSFHRMAQLIEQVDEDYLKRWGFDNDGALYKFVQRIGEEGTPGNVVGGDYSGSPGLKHEDPIYGVEKKTREYEDFTDFRALTAGLSLGSPAEKKSFLFRNINLPNFANFMAVRALISEQDVNRKNFYMLRDTERSQEWFLLPWDKDFTLGVNYSTSASTNRNNPWQSTSTFKHDPTGTRQWCVLWQSGYENLEIRAMVGRRLRTLMDTMMLAPGTEIPGASLIEQRLESVRALLATLPPGVSAGSISGSYNSRATFDTWLANHRTALSTTYGPASGYNMIPATATAAPVVTIIAADANPASAAPGFSPQDHEFIRITNSSAEDIELTEWTLWNPGAATPFFTFAPGTVIPGAAYAPYNVLHVARDLPGFRARPDAPAAAEFVVGTYDGQLSARGEVIELRDGPLPSSRLVSTFSTPSNPTAAQTAFRITELMWAPVAPSTAELAAAPATVASDYEYIELQNIGAAPLDISGARFTRGVDFTFPPGSVLAPGERIILVADAAAFAARYGSIPFVGVYDGALDNAGERIRIEDATGEMILDFRYDPRWFPPTHAGGRALVVRHSPPDHATYDAPTHWAIGGTGSGTPGAGETSIATVYEGWRWDYFSESEIYLPSPPNAPDTVNESLVGPGADADGDIHNNLVAYAFGRHPRTGIGEALATAGTIHISGSNYLTITFRRRIGALDLAFIIESAEQPGASTWAETTLLTAPPAPVGDGTETVTYRDTTPLTPLPRVMRVRAIKP